MTRTALITGASGFVGHHVVEHLLAHTDWQVIGTYTYRHRGDPWRLRHLSSHPRLELIALDVAAPWGGVGDRLRDIDYVVNLAAESHVDRSITDPVPFIRNNVDETLFTLEWARQANPKVFIQFSTDEVYGPARHDELHPEWAPIVPSNPYSASKAAQEAIAVAYWRTYGVPVVVTNTMNVIGERQDPEKFLPMVISNLRQGTPIPIHADRSGTPGSRFYIHASNVASAIVHLLNHFPDGAPRYQEGVQDRPERFHIVGDAEIDNLALASKVADIIGTPLHYNLIDFHNARPGHDRRYALDGTKLAALGWQPHLDLDASICRVVFWELDNRGWPSP